MSLYNIENLQKNQNLQKLLNFLSSEANTCQLHVIEDHMHKLLLALIKFYFSNRKRPHSSGLWS
jgi:hypothetical protein